MVRSVYIHIPFCHSKCHYCSFVSFCNLGLKKDYLKALKEEIKYYYKNEKLKTLYLGGGTPSVLTVSEISSILNLFNLDKNTEITMELNPDDVDYRYLRSIYDLGINRVSFGCQSFDDRILKVINRRHDAGQVINTVRISQDVGFKNISLDFIYGLPMQNLEGFLRDLKMGVGLGVQHISLYGLKIDEGCYFYDNMPQSLPDDDIQAIMYEKAVELMKDLGFSHYEVSNFSKDGFNSNHNLTYWNNEEYYGFGVGASGYVDKIRYENKTSLEDFITNPIEKNSTHFVTQKECLEEEIFLGLRKLEGIDVKSINQKYNIDFEKKYSKIIDKYLGLKLLAKTDKGYSLTVEGVLVSNVVLADFIEDV